MNESAKSSKRYQPYDDLRFYPGMHLREERKRQLQSAALEPTDLTADDIVYCLGLMVTQTMYSIFKVVEDRWGTSAMEEVAWEWGRRRGHHSLHTWLAARGLENARLTPEVWARYQDYRHAISGPTHIESRVAYEGDRVILTRPSCLFHNGRPEGQKSLCNVICEGMIQGYYEVSPNLTLDISPCMSKGTSDSHCMVRFGFDRDRSGSAER